MQRDAASLLLEFKWKHPLYVWCVSPPLDELFPDHPLPAWNSLDLRENPLPLEDIFSEDVERWCERHATDLIDKARLLDDRQRKGLFVLLRESQIRPGLVVWYPGNLQRPDLPK